LREIPKAMGIISKVILKMREITRDFERSHGTLRETHKAMGIIYRVILKMWEITCDFE
jgi:hypothetical protein